ncbi:MAG: endolytic transglycosylase MltG [Bacilli bacterium]|nr:endolytic transglycosylase MltG [Bacilli bacterium]
MLILIILLFLILVGVYKLETGPVSSNTDPKLVTIEKGDNFFNISKKLKKQNLIKSETFYKLYIKFAKPSGLTVGDFELNEAMSTQEVVKVLSNKNNQKIDEVKLTFREGLNIPAVAKIVEEKTEISSNDFIDKITDIEFIKSLQKDYWFLTDSIFDERIYYPLEGYLFPDTYHFERKKMDAETIIKKMLDNTAEKLETYKSQIESNKYNIHELLTVASLVEQEAVTKEDRALVAGVFYNRLNSNMSLGSDVTTYYAAKKTLKDTLTKEELDDCNGYNTRCVTMKGLPVGPISNVSITSVEAAITPTNNDYYYFVADTDRKVYFNKTLSEHNQTISKLKSEGKWAA